MNVKDIELTVPARGGMKLHAAHIPAKRQWRVSDGQKHPVTIIRPARKVSHESR